MKQATMTASGPNITTESATVYVIDDDRDVRDSVAALVKSKGMIAQVFASAEEFLALKEIKQPGCVVMDVRMPGMSGLDLQQRMIVMGHPLPVVMVTGFADVSMAVRAMRNGAVTFLQKPCSDSELWQGIQLALEKDRNEITLKRQKSELETRFASLTEDEVAVLQKLLSGHANKKIAADLDIGLRTVELRRSNIMKKMGASSLPELVRMCILVGELSPETN